MTPPIQEPREGLNAAVAAEIRAEQGRRKLSVQALAELTGIPYGSLRRYLNAERHIDVAVLAEICQALDVAPDEFIRRARVDFVWSADIEVDSDPPVSPDELARRRAGRGIPEVQGEAARDEDD